jgi:hypothetical protein
MLMTTKMAISNLDPVSDFVKVLELSRTECTLDFNWHLRVQSADTRRFSLANREVASSVHSRQLPQTLLGFREYLAQLCPSSRDKAFRLKCRVWPMSPYGIFPIKFSDNLWFKGRTGPRENEGSAGGERDDAQYRGLMKLCHDFARSRPQVTVEFEVKIGFGKVGRAGHEYGRVHEFLPL